jgi:hypothetical protein
MNFGTIPDSHLTVDLVGFAWSAAYLVPLALAVGVVGVIVLSLIVRQRR